jgi:hypothetical protein
MQKLRDSRHGNWRPAIRLTSAAGVSGIEPNAEKLAANAARVRTFGRHARGASAKIGDCTIFVHFGKHFAALFGAGTRQAARAGKIEINLNQVSGARSDRGTAEGSQLISAAFQLLNLPCEAADADQATAPRAAFSGRHGLGPAA